MSKLEAWQRYRKASPCPICAGYGAYKPENRCKGFRTADEKGAYCTQIPSLGTRIQSLGGIPLYYHPFEGQEQGEGEVKRPRLRYKRSLWIEKGRLRHQAREAEARRPPTVRDFG